MKPTIPMPTFPVGSCIRRSQHPLVAYKVLGTNGDYIWLEVVDEPAIHKIETRDVDPTKGSWELAPQFAVGDDVVAITAQGPTPRNVLHVLAIDGDSFWCRLGKVYFTRKVIEYTRVTSKPFEVSSAAPFARPARTERPDDIQPGLEEDDFDTDELGFDDYPRRKPSLDDDYPRKTKSRGRG